MFCRALISFKFPKMCGNTIDFDKNTEYRFETTADNSIVVFDKKDEPFIFTDKSSFNKCFERGTEDGN